MTERFVRAGAEYFAGSRGFASSLGNIEVGQASTLAEKEKETREAPHYLDTEIRPKRYRESARKQGQEDLDTNRGAVGQKTGRGGLPTQERGQRGYSHHA